MVNSGGPCADDESSSESQQQKKSEDDHDDNDDMMCCCRRRVGIIIIVAVLVFILVGGGAGAGIYIAMSGGNPTSGGDPTTSNNKSEDKSSSSGSNDYAGRWTAPVFGSCDPCTLQNNVEQAVKCIIKETEAVDETEVSCNNATRPNVNAPCTTIEYCGEWSPITFTEECDACTSSFKIDAGSVCVLGTGGEDPTGDKCNPLTKPSEISTCIPSNLCSGWRLPVFGDTCQSCTRTLNIVTPSKCYIEGSLTNDEQCSAYPKPTQESACDPEVYCGVWKDPVFTCPTPTGKRPVCDTSANGDYSPVVTEPRVCIDTRDDSTIMPDAYCDAVSYDSVFQCIF